MSRSEQRRDWELFITSTKITAPPESGNYTLGIFDINLIWKLWTDGISGFGIRWICVDCHPNHGSRLTTVMGNRQMGSVGVSGVH